MWSRHPPGADTPPEQTPPQSRHVPRSRHPPGSRQPPHSRHPPEQTPSLEWTTPHSRHPPQQTPPGADTPLEQTPPGADTSWEQTPPRSRHPTGSGTPPPPGLSTPPVLSTPPGLSTPPRAEHAVRYSQCTGGMHPTGMQSFVYIFFVYLSRILSDGISVTSFPLCGVTNKFGLSHNQKEFTFRHLFGLLYFENVNNVQPL